MAAVLGCMWMAALSTCGSDAPKVKKGLTGLKLTVHFDPSLELDRFVITGTLDSGDVAFAGGTLPDPPRKLNDGETLVILVPDSLGGRTVAVRVDGRLLGTTLASGLRRVLFETGKLVQDRMTLGIPAICQDGRVHPDIEGCDDGNDAVGDGCGDDCRIEPGFGCTNAPDGPSLCTPLPACSNGRDDDGDGLIDLGPDPGCESSLDTSELGDLACDNGLDDDQDGLTDLADPGCLGDARADAERCAPDAVDCPACDNGDDDDSDTLADFVQGAGGDPECTDPFDTSEEGPRACEDGLDNDGDGFCDSADGTCTDGSTPGDPGCVSADDASEREATLVCDNGVDDDKDTASDYPADPGCNAPEDSNERCPEDPLCPQCDDGTDNDGDGKTDYDFRANKVDPECTDAADNDESTL